MGDDRYDDVDKDDDGSSYDDRYDDDGVDSKCDDDSGEVVLSMKTLHNNSHNQHSTTAVAAPIPVLIV